MEANGDWFAVCHKLAKGDELRARRWRKRMRRWVHDPIFQSLIGQYSNGELILSMPSASQALGRRAGKGNVPAIKLAMEATGFHNPRLEHHHSGKIEIELRGVHRPPPVVDESEAITDADVVE